MSREAELCRRKVEEYRESFGRCVEENLKLRKKSRRERIRYIIDEREIW